MSSSCLTIDVGNSRWKFALIKRPEAGDARQLPEVLHAVATTPGEPLPWDAIRRAYDAFDGRTMTAIIAGSDPHGVQDLISRWPNGWSQPRVIDHHRSLPIDIDVREPDKVGLDRLLDGIAANVVRSPDRPAITVDSGTASVINYISADGMFSGGAILPGFDLGAKALHEYTALLPIVRRDNLCSLPPALGKDTQQALESGLYWGHVGGVKELVQQLAGLTDGDPPQVLLTGGAAPLLVDQLGEQVMHFPHLTLQGLALVEFQSR